MNYLLRVMTCVVLCLPSFALLAEPECAEDQPTPTPTSLAELLPEGGLDAVDIRFGFMGSIEQLDAPLPVYFYTTLVGEHGRLVCRFVTGSQLGEDGGRTKGVSVYTTEGRLVSFYSMSSSYGDTTERLGSAVEDRFVVFAHTTFNPNRAFPPDEVEPQTFERTEVPLDFQDRTCPVEWRPLVYAYHIRLGSTRFFARYSYADNRQAAYTEFVQFIGRRTINRADQAIEVNVFTVRTRNEPAEGVPTWRDAELTVFVADDGRVLGTEYPEGFEGLAYHFATAEQIAERFELRHADDNSDTDPWVMLPFEELGSDIVERNAD